MLIHNLREWKMLQVRVVLQGVDKHENLIASVLYSSGGEQGAQPLDLGLQLVEQGLARVMNHLPYLPYLDPTSLGSQRPRSYRSSRHTYISLGLILPTNPV